MEVDPQTFDTTQNLKTPSGLKSNDGLTSCGVGARWCLGQSPASFGDGRPLREVPACESTPWSRHPHDAAGTSTSTVLTRGDAGSHGLKMLFSVQHHDPGSHGLEMLFSVQHHDPL